MKLPRISRMALCWLAAACVVSAAEETPKGPRFDGTWRWDFTMPDGGQVTPSLKFKTKDGELTGTSRFRSGTEIPITNVVVKGNAVSFDVKREYLGDPVVTHYSGRLQGDVIKGKIVSKSGSEPQTYDWEANRASGVDGVWKWTVAFGERTFESRVTLKLEGDKLRGKMSGGRGGDLDIHHGRFKGDVVAFEVERRGFDGEKTTNVYRGKLEGDKITGTFTSTFRGLRTNEWHAARAD